LIGKRVMIVKLHVKKGDTVLVISGDDKGRKGKVLKVFPKQKRVLVEGINIIKRHTKARPPKVPQGGILEKAAPIHLSNIEVVESPENWVK